jgi:CheY-like chemotaxis protein
MYGKINVKSTVGEGTLVNIRLPQKTDGIGISGVIGKDTVESLRQFKLGNIIQLKKNQVIQEYMPYGHVLIVDDVETNLYVAQGLMAPYGLKIELAESGFEALDKVKAGVVYDVIFMDHMMPKMDGIETTKQLRKMGYTKSIVALTANALAGHAEMFLSNGFDDFVSKPIDIRQLNVTLNKLIRDKQPPEVLEAAQKEKAEFDKKMESGQGIQQVDLQLAKIFARDAKKAVSVIKTSMQNNLGDENQVQLYIINVHAMKSALLNIGEKDLSSVALRLEQAGRERNMNVISIETGEFLNNLEMVIKRIDKIEEEEHTEGTEDSQEALAFLDEKLQIIKKACVEMDKKTAKTILNDLRNKTWSRETGNLINSIAEHLLHSEFDEAAALIDSRKK